MQQKVLHSSPKTKTHSLFKRIPGTRRLMQKRQLFPEFRWASLSLFVLPRLTGSKTVPRPCSGIWTRFPFGCNLVSLHTVKSPNIWLRLPLSLRIDWLVSNGCSHETLLHIGPPGPLWSICYYHWDLHQGRLQPGSHPVAFGATPATFLLVVA